MEHGAKMRYTATFRECEQGWECVVSNGSRSALGYGSLISESLTVALVNLWASAPTSSDPIA